MTEPLLIADQWCSPPPDGATFHSFDPASGVPNPERFPVSDWAQLERIAEVARTATIALRETPPGRITTFLERFAEAIEDESGPLAAAAARETALPGTPGCWASSCRGPSPSCGRPPRPPGTSRPGAGAGPASTGMPTSARCSSPSTGRCW